MRNNTYSWPDQKKFCFAISHDVEDKRGLSKCLGLAKIEKDLGFRSCFSFVPERYEVPDEIKNYLIENGFEIAIHGLKHDGKLFRTETEFLKRAKKINNYIHDWGVSGFYAPSMIHNLEWMHNLDIKYDASTFDTDPFEPQSDVNGTIYPTIIKNEKNNSHYIEIPYTLAQDITIFIILEEKNTDLWRQKLTWLVENEGLVFIKTHPDYMYWENGKKKIDEYQSEYYIDFLKYIKEKYKGEYWHALPRQIASFVDAKLTKDSDAN